jgi:hypothetical protein
MRKGLSIQFALVLFALSSITAQAQADVIQSPAPTASAQPDPYKIALDQFKQDRDIYIQAMRDREQKIRAINQTFNIAVNKASQDARTLMQAATSPEQKSAAKNAQRTAVANAITAHENAISALGQLPAAPVEPVRPPKNVPAMKDSGGGKNRR